MNLRRFCDLLEAKGRRNNLSLYAPRLGRELYALGRLDEAEALARQGRELAAEADITPQIRLASGAGARRRCARPLRRRPRPSRGRRSRSRSGRTRSTWQGEASHDLAEVLAAGGRTDEAVGSFEQALDRFERKKNLAMVAQVRPRLEALRGNL